MRVQRLSLLKEKSVDSSHLLHSPTTCLGEEMGIFFFNYYYYYYFLCVLK